jgi:diguanylate cyclase (GGDEF)-like protein
MTKQVILLRDAQGEEAAEGLRAFLRDAGIFMLTDWMPAPGSNGNGRGPESPREEVPLPLAVLYEVCARADVLSIHAAIEHAQHAWPGAPLVALRPSNGHLNSAAHVPDSATLKRLGFRAVAERAAQLPALLRELEEHVSTSELRLPFDLLNEMEAQPPQLPAHLGKDALHAAFQLVARLHAAHDQKSAAQGALSGLDQLVSADCWTIYLASETSDDSEAVRLEPLAVHAQAAPQPASEKVLSLSGSESSAARQAAARMEMTRKTEGERRVLALPLISGERVMAVLEAVRERREAGPFTRPFTKREGALLSALAAPLSSALANSVRIAEAERLSQTDDLTKLHNARYLRQFLLVELRRARRYGSSVSALFFDIDDFKRINDAHGHLVGSHVLMEMAAAILTSVRDTDMVARYGGDEFVVVLPETPIELAAHVAERIRARIESHTFTGGRRLQLHITASFGVAAFPQHAPSPQQLVACADAAMYEAKAAGKNRVRTAI